MTAPDLNRFVRTLCVTLATCCLTTLSQGQSIVRGHAGFSDIQPIEKIGVIDEDDRRTETDYARENGMTLSRVQELFGATGALKCPGSEGTAQVTLSPSVITTAAHLFYDAESCRKISDPGGCVFESYAAGITKKHRIKDLSAIGFSCPSRPGFGDDWAVLNLEHPTAGITPYQLPSNRKYPAGFGDQLIAVTVGALDFFGTSKNKKAIGNCTAKNDGIRDDGSLAWLQSNCDTSSGASGGSMLISSSEGGYELVAVIKGSSESDAGLKRAVARRRPNTGPYSEGKWGSTGIAVTSDFYDAIVKAGR